MEAKIVAELQSLGLMPTAENPQPRELTYSDACELTYLQAVIKVRLMSGQCLLSDLSGLTHTMLSNQSARGHNSTGHCLVSLTLFKDTVELGRLHLPAGTCSQVTDRQAHAHMRRMPPWAFS